MYSQGRRQLREIGGGAKLKSRGQRFSTKCEGLFWPKSQIFRPKAGDLTPPPKKRSSPKSEGFFWPKSNFNVFSAPKHQLLPLKKIPWGEQEKNRGGKNENRGGIAPPLATRLCTSKTGNFQDKQNLLD